MAKYIKCIECNLDIEKEKFQFLIKGEYKYRKICMDCILNKRTNNKMLQIKSSLKDVYIYRRIKSNLQEISKGIFTGVENIDLITAKDIYTKDITKFDNMIENIKVNIIYDKI